MESKEMDSSVVPSPGGSSSPIRRENSAGALLYLRLSPGDLEKLDVTFGKDEGFLRKETDEVPLSVAGVHDEYPLITVFPTPEAPQVQLLEVTRTSRLDKLYEPHFQRLDRFLAALLASIAQENAQAIQHHGSPPVTEGTALMASKRQENAQVFPSVAEGKVPELGVVGVGAGGELVFGSELADHKAVKAK